MGATVLDRPLPEVPFPTCTFHSIAVVTQCAFTDAIKDQRLSLLSSDISTRWHSMLFSMHIFPHMPDLQVLAPTSTFPSEVPSCASNSARLTPLFVSASAGRATACIRHGAR